VIEDMDEFVEAGLLFAGSRRLPAGEVFPQGEMHALVTTILLGFDALEPIPKLSTFRRECPSNWSVIVVPASSIVATRSDFFSSKS
jgi:hypothetical protein